MYPGPSTTVADTIITVENEHKQGGDSFLFCVAAHAESSDEEMLVKKEIVEILGLYFYSFAG